MKSLGRLLCALTLVAAFALIGFAVAGCENLGDGTTDTTLTTTSVTDSAVSTETTGTTAATETTTAPATPTTLASTEEVLPNGNIKSMGFIDDVWVSGGTRYLSIDYCEFVYGEEATDAARADGEIGPTEEWDLDFYIRNQSSRLRTWAVSGSVVITTATRWAPHDGFEAPCTWEDFIGFWGPGPFPDGDSWLHSVPWWIERDGETVVKISEQYLP